MPSLFTSIRQLTQIAADKASLLLSQQSYKVYDAAKQAGQFMRHQRRLKLCQSSHFSYIGFDMVSFG